LTYGWWARGMKMAPQPSSERPGGGGNKHAEAPARGPAGGAGRTTERRRTRGAPAPLGCRFKGAGCAAVLKGPTNRRVPHSVSGVQTRGLEATTPRVKTPAAIHHSSISRQDRPLGPTHGESHSPCGAARALLPTGDPGRLYLTRLASISFAGRWRVRRGA